jgi:hypothetical protein
VPGGGLSLRCTTSNAAYSYERWNTLKPRQFLWMVAKCLAGLWQHIHGQL